MAATYWHKQSADQPLFPDLLWSRPENKRHAGKLLLISGNAQGFAVAAQAYQVAANSGAGVVRVLLPDILQKLVPAQVRFEVEFLPSITQGGFAKTALVDILDSAAWCDAVLLPGGIGRNSETYALFEQVVSKYMGLLIVAEEALDVFVTNPQAICNRKDTIVVADFSQFQKMWLKFMPAQPAVTYGMPLPNLVAALHDISEQLAATWVIKHQDTLLVGHQGQISTTKYSSESWRVETSAKAAVWALQNPTRLFEALTSAIYES